VEIARSSNRGRARAFMREGLYMHNLEHLVYCLGEEFVAPSWTIVDGPLDQVCYEVPLPDRCPLHWTGKNCDKCKSGFTGPKCDRCLPKHFGSECKPCRRCNNGMCEVKQDQVGCKCNAFYHGASCEVHLPTEPNLISDRSFSSLAARGSSQWREFGEESCSVANNDELWLSNNGGKCGATHEIILNQVTNAPVVVSAESKCSIISSYADAASYSVYVDITFQDGTYHWGKNAPFTQGKHDWEYGEMVIQLKKPILSFSLYLMFNLEGRAAFRNVVVKEKT